MPDFYDYTGCKIIVHDIELDTTIAETYINEFNKSTHTVTIATSSLRDTIHNRVSVLIFCNNTLYEYQGTLRKTDMLPGFIGIALYKGKPRENRTAVRYEVNTPAIVENFIITGKLVPLYIPQEVLVVNLSTVGCLILGNYHFFNVNTTFQLKLPLGHSDMLLKTTVLRINSVGDQAAEYGCKFNLPDSPSV